MHFYQKKFTGHSIVLSQDDWDDFGYKTRFSVEYADEHGNLWPLGFIHIGIEGQITGRTIVPNDFERLPDNMFSMGSIDFYECLKNSYPELRVEILKSLNDIAFNLDLYFKFKNQWVVKTSFLRFYDAKTLLRELRPLAEGRAIPTSFNYNYLYQKDENNKNNTLMLNFLVDPDSKPSTNIYAIIGSNGVGKTYFLKSIYKAFVTGDNSLKIHDIDIGSDLKNAELSNAMFISFSAFDSGNIFNEIGNNDKGMVLGMKKFESGVCVNKTENDLNDDFQKAFEKCCQRGRLYLWLDIFKRIDETILKGERGFVRQLIPNNDMSISELEKMGADISKKGRAVFSHLSSGHKIVMLTLTQLIAYVNERTLVLIDEPEMHLHPPLVAIFMELISKVLNVINGFAIVATHSSVVLQEIPRDCIYILEKHGEVRTVEQPPIATYGENLGKITKEIFGYELSETGYYRKMRDESKVYNNFDDAIDSFTHPIGEEARSLLRMFIYERQKDEKARNTDY